MQRILVIRFSSLGDVVLMSALLEALRRGDPAAEIWLATKERYSSLYRHDPRVHRVLELTDGADGLRALLREVREARFDLVLDAHASIRSRLLCSRLRGSPPVRRISKDSFARTLFVRARIRTASLERRLVDRYLALSGRQDGGAVPTVHSSAGDRRSAEEVLAGHVLAVAPGARHEPKRWPAERFATVAARHQARTRCTVLVVGGPGEEVACAAVASRLDPGRTHVLVGNQDLSTVAAFLGRSTLLVCNDSGLMHLAEAAGTPVTAVFGPTSVELGYFPWRPRSRVVEQDVPCRPCSRFGSRPCHLEANVCLTRSSTDLVYAMVESQWARIVPPARRVARNAQRHRSLPAALPVVAPPVVSPAPVGQQHASH